MVKDVKGNEIPGYEEEQNNNISTDLMDLNQNVHMRMGYSLLLGLVMGIIGGLIASAIVISIYNWL